MFFLRQVALEQEGGGEAFLRDQLRRPPLSLFPWAAFIDDRLSAFMAGDRLPQVYGGKICGHERCLTISLEKSRRVTPLSFFV